LDQIDATSTTGSRTAIHGLMGLVTPTSNNGSNAFYVSVEGDSSATVPDGGTPGNYKGVLNGAFFSSSLTTNATNWVNEYGVEVNVGADASSSARFKTGIAIELSPHDATRGLSYDTALSIIGSAGTSSTGWGNGISFGGPDHRWAFASDSNLIVATPNSLNDIATPLLANSGINFGKVLFSSSSLQLPGFIVGPTGNTSIANALISATSSGISIDIPDQIVTSAAISAAGSGCTVADLLYFGTQGIATVTSIGGSGNVTGISLSVPDTSSSPPANPVTTTSESCTVAPALNRNLFEKKVILLERQDGLRWCR
jgi:hypothetical protein